MNIGCMIDTDPLSNGHPLEYYECTILLIIFYAYIHINVFVSNEKILKHTVYLSTKITLITLKE